jgi:hypothetical protein
MSSGIGTAAYSGRPGAGGGRCACDRRQGSGRRERRPPATAPDRTAHLAICLVVLIAAPAVTVVGYELLGQRHLADALARRWVGWRRRRERLT